MPSAEYRRTLFEELGYEAADLYRIAIAVIMPTIAGAFIGGALAVRAGLMPAAIVLSFLVGGLLGGASAALFMVSIYRGAGAFVGLFVLPTGNQSPYERQYSYEDSLVMRGDIAGALTSYERIIAEAPGEAQPRLRAAEVCLKSGFKERAESFFRDVQRLPGLAAKDDIYATNRLVDLYRGWPGNETKALRELRRLVDKYPNTDVAARARNGLATLKGKSE